MLRPVTSAPKGVLDPAGAREKLQLSRVHASPDLAPFVEHHWIVAWDLRGQEPYVQRTLPYPCVHIVFERKGTFIHGVMRGPFEYRLEGKDRVLGIRFRAGAFRAFLGKPVGTITDRSLPLSSLASLSSLLAIDEPTLRTKILDAPSDAEMVHAAESLLRPLLPKPDPTIALIAAILERIESTPDLSRVDDLATHAGLSMRDLQRLFADYVGVSPKWVIRRARLHEAAHRLSQGDPISLSSLAQELGYFDQAHLTRDFTRHVGRPPSTYHQASKPR